MKDSSAFSGSAPEEAALASDTPVAARPFRLVYVSVTGVVLGLIFVVGINSVLNGTWSQARAGTRQTRFAPFGAANPTNFFDLRRPNVETQEILHSGQRKDYKLALVDPEFLSPNHAEFLSAADEVIGLTLQGESRCYPLEILEYHELANDHFGTQPVLVSYCPLSESMAVFDARVNDEEVRFGVSGLIYNSNSLFYDRNNGGFEALWSSVRAESLTNSRRSGGDLDVIPFEVTTWSDWRDRHPDTKVLSPHSGKKSSFVSVDYDPGNAEGALPHPVSPVPPAEMGVPARARVLGVWHQGAARAYPIQAFSGEQASGENPESLDEQEFTLAYNPEAKSLRVAEADDSLNWVYSSWSVWYSAHPETEVYPTPTLHK